MIKNIYLSTKYQYNRDYTNWFHVIKSNEYYIMTRTRCYEYLYKNRDSHFNNNVLNKNNNYILNRQRLYQPLFSYIKEYKLFKNMFECFIKTTDIDCYFIYNNKIISYIKQFINMINEKHDNIICIPDYIYFENQTDLLHFKLYNTNDFYIIYE